MVKIDAKGTIVNNDDKWIYDWFGYDAFCPKDIDKQLEDANGDDVTIVINSGGGDVFAGSDMSYSISQYKGKDASEVSDVFLTVQNLGKTSVNELASSIGKVATNAANYGVSLQDLGTAYIQLTKRGIETTQPMPQRKLQDSIKILEKHLILPLFRWESRAARLMMPQRELLVIL